MRIHTSALLVTAAVGLAACGSGSGGGENEPSGNGGRDSDQEAMLQFAKCMRGEGIDFPDPRPGGGPQVIGPDGDASPEEMRAAERACAKYRRAIDPPELSEEQQREFKDAALANARCMREHGIDMPDPKFGADGSARIELARGVAGPDPTSAKFKEAQEACKDTLPAGGSLDEEDER